ncbi:MAG: phosphate transport system regulatory protein PhoU, partial [Planctomycetes bacterium GWF2_50_10]
MAKHLQREIDILKRKILSLGTAVEESVRDAVESLETRNVSLAKRVIDNDQNIDHNEIDVEEECLKILALHQPVAIDLRFIIAVLKINNDLERIGDLAVNIAERALFLAGVEKIDIALNFIDMAKKAQVMLKTSLDALVTIDVSLAKQVLAQDDAVDEENRRMYMQVQEGIKTHPDQMEALIHLLSTSRHIERIADHATNIAEDVIYMIEGDIVR